MNKTNFIIALSMLAPMFASNSSGSFARTTTPLLSALRKMKRRGYKLVVWKSEDNKDRIHFMMFSPKMKRRLAHFKIYPGLERDKDGNWVGGSTWMAQTTPTPTNTYNVEGAYLSPHLHGMGKAIYFAVLLWTTNQKSWLGS